MLRLGCSICLPCSAFITNFHRNSSLGFSGRSLFRFLNKGNQPAKAFGEIITLPEHMHIKETKCRTSEMSHLSSCIFHACKTYEIDHQQTKDYIFQFDIPKEQ